ncbi:uncharacterized protein LOC129319616 [Prosopis cineraria]|uniref:uncharacterized protein LOC129319616 n=1 Tax=Prosopis cineraria TaxID=364024 RepID=UPI00240F68EA|nr:uncharacterized protein LOC129319616 [Prosopis cineraria]
MSSENAKIEPNTDLELGTNDPSHCIWKTLNNDSGAGANASSRLDMKFVASNALSELVWSPDKGLSLKCADSSFADKNASLFWDVGSCNMVLAPPQSAIGESSPADEPVAATCVKTGINDIDIDTPIGHPTSDPGVKPEYKAHKEHETGFIGNMEGTKTADGVLKLHDQKENVKICNEDNTGTAHMSQMKGQKSSTISGEVNKRSFDVLLHQVDELKSSMEQNPLPRDPASGGGDIGISNQEIETNDDLCAKDELVTEYKGTGAGTNSTSSSRGALEKLESTAENDSRTFNCDAACGASGNLASNSREIDNKSQDNEMIPLCDTNLPILHSPSNSEIKIINIKGKEKALPDGDVRLSKEDEEEDDSHESVESCNSAGLFLKGKRSWNLQQQLMVGSKRFKKQVQEASSPKYFVKQDSSFMNWISNMRKGFSQTIRDEVNPLPLTLEHTNHGHQLLIQNSSQAIRRTVIQSQKVLASNPFFRPYIAPGEQELQVPVIKKEIVLKIYVTKNMETKVGPINAVISHESSKNDSVENKNCFNLFVQQKSSWKSMDNSIFSKSTASLTISDHSKTPEHKFKNEDSREAKESHSCCSMYGKTSIDAKNNLDDDHKSIHYLNPVSPSPKVTNSETIASAFARRLDATKHINPLYRTSSTTHMNKTCMFCGTRGHQLHDCSEIAESELEALQKNISSYGKLEELPCLCIRCFQPNHWAISCPTSVQIGQHDMKVSALVNDCSPNETNFNSGKEETARPLPSEVDYLLPGGAINAGIDPEANQNLDLKQSSNEMIPSENIGSRVLIKEVFGSSSMECRLKGSSMTSPYGFIGRQISDKTKRIFDAVKKLRLSRTEILKWINSHMSISNLDGFFLRLRLGKWEEGLWRSGYVVASINESQRQSPQQKARRSISVTVGGIKCMVESQYISNHDFLEEEIMAWWDATSKAGNNIPSEEDLIEKVKKKHTLGF